MEQSKKNAHNSVKAADKKPYVKPSCESEPIYETLALACGKIPGQSAFCNHAVKRS